MPTPLQVPLLFSKVVALPGSNPWRGSAIIGLLGIVLVLISMLLGG